MDLIIGLLSSQSLHVMLVGVIVLLCIAIKVLWDRLERMSKKNEDLMDVLIGLHIKVDEVKAINLAQSSAIVGVVARNKRVDQDDSTSEISC